MRGLASASPLDCFVFSGEQLLPWVAPLANDFGSRREAVGYFKPVVAGQWLHGSASVIGSFVILKICAGSRSLSCSCFSSKRSDQGIESSSPCSSYHSAQPASAALSRSDDTSCGLSTVCASATLPSDARHNYCSSESPGTSASGKGARWPDLVVATYVSTTAIVAIVVAAVALMVPDSTHWSS